MASLTQWTQWSLSKLQETVMDREACHAAVCGVTKNQTQLINWTTTKMGEAQTFVLLSYWDFSVYLIPKHNLAYRVCMLSPTFFDPMDCSPPGSSVHVILQARTPGVGCLPSSRGSSWLRDGTGVSYFFTTSATREALLFVCRNLIFLIDFCILTVYQTLIESSNLVIHYFGFPVR